MDLIARNQFTIVEKFSDVINNLDYNDVANICTQMQSRNFCFPPDPIFSPNPTNENVYKKTESEELTYV